MQLHATMVNGVRETFCGDLSDSMAALLLSSLPALPLKTPQQRSWAAACCVATLDLCELQCYQGEHAILFLQGHHREGLQAVPIRSANAYAMDQCIQDFSFPQPKSSLKGLLPTIDVVNEGALLH